MQNSSIDDLCDDKHFSIWAFECMNRGYELHTMSTLHTGRYYQGFYTIIGYAVAIRQNGTAYTDNVFRQVYITL